MSDILPYELLISEKLQTLPVPDLADAIWSRIEARLDLELPTDGGDEPPSPTAGPSDILKGFGFSVILIIVLFFLTRLTNNNNNAVNDSIPVSTPSIIRPAGNDPPPEINSPVTRNPPVLTPESTPVTATVDDSASAAPAMPVPVIDSLQPIPEPLVSPAVVRPDTIVKKPRGVPNIKPGDYRIEPAKKD